MKIQLKSIFICFCCVLLLCGCSGGKSKAQKLKESELKAFIKDLPESKIIQTVWERNLGDFKDLGFHFVVDQEVIYSVDAKGLLSAVGINKGELLWQTKTRFKINTGLGVSSMGLFAVDTQANLLAFDRQDGKLLWQTAILSDVMVPPVVVANTVVVKTTDARLIGYDENSGTESWLYRHRKPYLTLHGGSRPIVANNILITGFEDGSLVAVNGLTGYSLWNIPVGRSSGIDEISRLNDIDSQPLLVGYDLYVGSFQRRVMAMNVQQGLVTWSRNISSYRNFTVDTDNLYLIDDRANVIALERASGKLAWAQQSLEGASLETLTILNGNLLISSGSGMMFVLDPNNGDVLSKQEISGGPLLDQPQVINDIAYMLSKNGDFVAVKITN